MDAKEFGKFISQLRREKQLTQAELGKKLQVSDKAVSRWERRGKIWSLFMGGIGVLFCVLEFT